MHAAYGIRKYVQNLCDRNPKSASFYAGNLSKHIVEWHHRAGLAQLVEHFIRNEGVAGSSPVAGTMIIKNIG